jgi:hypothetical protein
MSLSGKEVAVKIRKRGWIAGLMLSALSLTACTHVYTLPAREGIEPLAVSHKLSERAFALLVAKPGVQDSYSGQAQGNQFEVNEVPAFVRHVYGRMLTGSVKSYRAIDSATSVKPAETMLVPEVKLSFVSEMLSAKCVADIQLVAKSAKGEMLAQTKASAEHTFAIMQNSGRACEIAMYASLEPAMKNLLQELQ